MSENNLPNVLHIEDNADIALVVAKVLKKVANITHVVSLADARTKLAEGTYNLALLDLVLPDGSGLDLVNELKNSSPPIPIIIHSAHEVSDNIRNVDAVLSKMHTKHDVLRDLVRDLTSQKKPAES